LLIFLNLGLVSIGIGSAWKRWRLAGLIPLLAQIGYYLANAVVRNSGARYLVPVDWAVLLYFVIGLVQASIWLRAVLTGQLTDSQAAARGSTDAGEEKATPLPWPRGALIAGLFLFVGSWLPLSRYLFPDRLPEHRPEQILKEIQTTGWQDRQLADWLITIEGSQLLNDPEVVVVKGRGFYPRFYEYGQGESDGELALMVLPAEPEPRFTMRVLTSDRAYIAVLPSPIPPSAIPDDVETVVIGCRYGEAGHIDAAAILLMGDDMEVLWRDPNVDLTCPLPLP
jgi:hypothetical protein